MSIEKKDLYENKPNENKNEPSEAELLRQELRNELAYFIGSEEFYKVYPKVTITEGVKFLAERAKAVWLIDLVFSYQADRKVSQEPFQVYELSVDLITKKAKMICTDGNENILRTQNIPFTTFPLESIKLYYSGGVLMLPSEY
jgi:hypothetical protein